MPDSPDRSSALRLTKSIAEFSDRVVGDIQREMDLRSLPPQLRAIIWGVIVRAALRKQEDASHGR